MQAYLFDGYWEDIGTIEAFYNANLGITKKPVPDFRYVLWIHWVIFILIPVVPESRKALFIDYLDIYIWSGAASMIDQLQSTLNLDICLHLRCWMLMSRIASLEKGV